ncbi:7618_t:CDS:2, partial [Paraglomus occultum]
MKSGDGGVDMIVFHEDCTIFIQCKNHTGNIGRGPVQALGGWLSRLFLCCWSIVVAHRNNEKEEKFDDAAVIVKEAETCRNSIRLSYASTIVEDIENLVSTALAIKEKPVHWRFGEET